MGESLVQVPGVNHGKDHHPQRELYLYYMIDVVAKA